MRILHILDKVEYSGAEVMLHSAAPYWLQMGIKLHAISLSDTPGKFESQLQASGWELERFSISTFSFRSWLGLAKTIKGISPDLIQTHSNTYAWIISVIAKIQRRPVIHVIHHAFIPGTFSKLRNYLKRFIMRRLRVLSVTNSLGNQMIEIQAYKNPTILVSNWIPLSERAPKESSYVRNRKLRLLTVGKCSIYKGHLEVMKALGELRNLGVDFELIHVGSLGETFDDEIDYLKQERLIHNVKFVSEASSLQEYFNWADILVHPSREEGFSIAAAEFLSLGKPIVISNRLSHNLVFAGRHNVHLVEPSAEFIAKEIIAASTPSQRHREVDIQIRNEEWSPIRGAILYKAIYDKCIKELDFQDIRVAADFSADANRKFSEY